MKKLICLKVANKELGTIHAYIVTDKIKAFYFSKKQNRTYVCVDDSLSAYWFPGDQTEKIIAAIEEGD